MLEAMPETPLITYLRIQQATDRQVLAALRVSAGAVSSELRRLQAQSGAGAAMRREQVLRSQVAINRELETLYRRVGDVVKASAADAAAAGAETILRESEGLLRSVLSASDYDYLMRSARASAAQSLEVLRQRVSGSSYVPLAESVWGNQRWANSSVNNMVNAALARGASAAELAKEVRAFVNPNTPGGVRYASMRLARTELNNAFHAAQVKQAQEEPWTTAVRWHLSGSHPVPDECNDYAEREHFDGGEAGLWKPSEVPAKPHPNCLCYTTPETLTPEQFIKQYMKGDFDSYLDQNDLPPAPPAPSPRPPAPPTKKSATPPPPPAPPAPAVKAPFADLKALKKQESYREALKEVNPVHTKQEYLNNCHFVVNAMEMRARGFNVVAAPTFRNIGRYLDTIARDWRDSEGRVRKFEPVRWQKPPKTSGTASPRISVTNNIPQSAMDGIIAQTESWPVGARGFVNGDWSRGGGAHIFNVYKDEAGVLRFVDGQVAKDDVASYLARMDKVWVMRVDDLEPVEERVRDAVKERSVLITKKVELERARVQERQAREDANHMPKLYQHYWVEMADKLARAIKKLEKEIG